MRKWQERGIAKGEGGLAGLRDRSSRPHVSPTRLDEAAEATILALRRERLSGPAIAQRLGRPVATVGLVLRRHGLSRLRGPWTSGPRSSATSASSPVT